MTENARSAAISQTAARVSRAMRFPCCRLDRFREHVVGGGAGGARLAALFGEPVDGDQVRLHAVLADGRGGTAFLVCDGCGRELSGADAGLSAGTLVRA